MSDLKVRINGRGNAWPVILGQNHPFYDRKNYQDLANASFSIVKANAELPKESDIEWDLMIDAGHGAVQYLLHSCNRIPEAIFLTHPHIDHTLGLDWIVQSFYKTYQKPYPVYTTILCWQIVQSNFPHLKGMIEFKELLPYRKIKIDEVRGVELIPFPVYHGKSALGATMLLFIINDSGINRKVLFTGDILCPILRKEDYEKIKEVDLLVTDANNRFPYPKSNHWSIVDNVNGQTFQFLKEFIEQSSIGLFLQPHINNLAPENYQRSFDYFFNTEILLSDFYFTIQAFVERINPQKTALVHYSGGEDNTYYGESIFTDKELQVWVNTLIESKSRTHFLVPYVSQHIDFITNTKSIK